MKQMTVGIFRYAILAFLLLSTACASATPTPAAAPTSTPVPPTATSIPTNTFTPTPICDLAAFIQDVTVSDGTVFQPGQAFTKTWRAPITGLGKSPNRMFSAGPVCWMYAAFMRASGCENEPVLPPPRSRLPPLCQGSAGGGSQPKLEI